jgi:curved DNA-binding protein
MSESFCDYYEVLQLSPNADLHTIERVYRLLAKNFHPDNQVTGSVQKFELLTTAYKTLSNPEKRASYDATYGQAKKHQWQAISKAYSSEGFGSDQHVRRMVLSILYTKRREDPSEAAIGVVQLENLIEWPGQTLDFHVWYLKEKKLIERTENGGFQITAIGVDKIEEDGLALRKDRLLAESTSVSQEDIVGVRQITQETT